MRIGSEGCRQCCNAQVAMDGEHRLIVATELTSNASDQGALLGLLNEVGDRFGAQPGIVLADAGYCNERALSELEARGIDGDVATGREGRRSGGQGRGEAPCDTPHGRKAGHTRGPGAVCATQTAVRGAQRLDQGGPRLPAVRHLISIDYNLLRWDECAHLPAGWGQNHPYRGLCRTFRTLRGPCPPLRTFGVPVPVPVPASGPSDPSAHVPELPFHGAGS